MEIGKIKDGIREVTLTSWNEFNKYLEEEWLDQSGYIFRGQADSTWKIKSSFSRLKEANNTMSVYQCHPARKKKNITTHDCPPCSFKRHIKAYKECVLPYLMEAYGIVELSKTDFWALAQHHGLPTPLVDWTYSPFVALFFAMQEQNNTETCSVYRFSISLPMNISMEQQKIDFSPFVPSVVADKRLNAQQGILMYLGGDDYSHDNITFESCIQAATASSTNRLNEDPWLEKIIIPKTEEDRKQCLKWLDKMNINFRTLFPDFDGAARYIKMLWELNFDTPLGWISNDK